MIYYFIIPFFCTDYKAVFAKKKSQDRLDSFQPMEYGSVGGGRGGGGGYSRGGGMSWYTVISRVVEGVNRG